MQTRFCRNQVQQCGALVLLATLFAGGAVNGQVPVDAAGEPYPTSWERSQFDSSSPTTGASIETLGEDAIPILRARELDELVGPVALYPDNLLAVVLPAAAYPLQIVQAARFLEELEADPSLTPSPDWDEAVVALLNYPEVLEQLNADIEWTLRLGEAVIAQQGDVIDAVQRFRDRAYMAGNLESDERQNVVRADEIIEITPVSESTIYVPYYEPETVIRHTVQPVYSYYPEPYPVYYYPYPDGHAFRNGYFWGVTSAYALGWRQERRLRVIHHSFAGHPYYGHRYGWRWWYRRPSLVYHNNLYYRPNRTVVRHHAGDYWTPRYTRRTPWASTPRISTTREARRYSTRQTTRSHGETNRRQRPSMASVERSLRQRENSLRERETWRSNAGSRPADSNRRSSVPGTPPSRSRSTTTRRPPAAAVTPRSSSPPVYRRNEPLQNAPRRTSGSTPKYSSRPAPTRSARPSTSARSPAAEQPTSRRSVTRQGASPHLSQRN